MFVPVESANSPLLKSDCSMTELFTVPSLKEELSIIEFDRTTLLPVPSLNSEFVMIILLAVESVMTALFTEESVMTKLLALPSNKVVFSKTLLFCFHI